MVRKMLPAADQKETCTAATSGTDACCNWIMADRRWRPRAAQAVVRTWVAWLFGLAWPYRPTRTVRIAPKAASDGMNSFGWYSNNNFCRSVIFLLHSSTRGSTLRLFKVSASTNGVCWSFAIGVNGGVYRALWLWGQGVRCFRTC